MENTETVKTIRNKKMINKTDEERKQARCEANKKYYEANKTKIIANQIAIQNRDKDKKNANAKLHYQRHREEILAKRKAHSARIAERARVVDSA